MNFEYFAELREHELRAIRLVSFETRIVKGRSEQNILPSCHIKNTFAGNFP